MVPLLSPRARVGRGAPRVYGPDLVETLLVCAISTVIVVRLYLASTGYPKIGGDGFHFAHVLWGGLLMLVAAILVLAVIGRSALQIGAALSGVGFGLFIDEVGKFVTSDVDYFFQPALAIIYVTFILLALFLVSLRQRLRIGPIDALANALALTHQAVFDPHAADVRRDVLELLDQADPADPLVPALRARIAAAAPSSQRRPGVLHRTRVALEDGYRRLALSPVFVWAVIAWFAVAAVSSISAVVYLAMGDDTGPADEGPVVHTLQLAASLASAACVVAGIWYLRRSRLRAYRWFQRAILISILITHVFVFYDSQLAALTGLAVSLLVYVGLRYAIAREIAGQGEAEA